MFTRRCWDRYTRRLQHPFEDDPGRVGRIEGTRQPMPMIRRTLWQDLRPYHTFFDICFCFDSGPLNGGPRTCVCQETGGIEISSIVILLQLS